MNDEPTCDECRYRLAWLELREWVDNMTDGTEPPESAARLSELLSEVADRHDLDD